MSQKPLWERATYFLSVFPLSLRPVGWMSPKQRQNFEQWLGAEPDRVANGEPGETPGDANDWAGIRCNY